MLLKGRKPISTMTSLVQRHIWYASENLISFKALGNVIIILLLLLINSSCYLFSINSVSGIVPNALKIIHYGF